MGSDFNSQIQSELSHLGTDSQRLVLEYVRTLRANASDQPKKDPIDFAGAISKEDLNLMRAAIEAGCEQVDLNDW